MILELIAQHGTLTSAQLVEMTGTDRQRLRHQMDKLEKEGLVVKTVVNRVASFSIPVAHQIATVAQANAPMADQMGQVVRGLRTSKALSIRKIAARVHLSVPLVRDLLRQAVGMGLAERPFKGSERYRLPQVA